MDQAEGSVRGTSCSPVAVGCREASDRRADVGARRERGAGGQGARGEREPGVQVATGLRARRAVGAGCGIRVFASGSGFWRRQAAFGLCDGFTFELHGRALISIESGADPALLRTILESLRK